MTDEWYAYIGIAGAVVAGACFLVLGCISVTRVSKRLIVLIRSLPPRATAAAIGATIAFVSLWIAADDPTRHEMSREQWALIGITAAVASIAIARRWRVDP